MKLLNMFWSGRQLSGKRPEQCIIFRPSGTTGTIAKDCLLPCFKLVLSHNTVDFDLSVIGTLGSLSSITLNRIVGVEKQIHRYTDFFVKFDGLDELETLLILKYG